MAKFNPANKWALLLYYGGDHLSCSELHESENAARKRAVDQMAYGYTALICKVTARVSMTEPSPVWSEEG